MDENYYQNQPQIIDDNPNNRPLKLSDWIVTMVVMAIPCIGTIMLFVWGFGSGNINRKRYCQATLILTAIVFVLYIVIFAISGAALLNFIKESIESASVIQFIK